MDHRRIHRMRKELFDPIRSYPEERWHGEKVDDILTHTCPESIANQLVSYQKATDFADEHMDEWLITKVFGLYSKNY